MKLDYSIKDLALRQAEVNKYLEANPNPTPKELEYLGNYLVYCLTPEEKKNKRILTENRKTTIYGRELSYEGLSEKFENGEDGIYGILSNDRHTIFHHKITITDEDLANFPEISQAKDAVEYWTKALTTADPKNKAKIQQALVQARRNQYSIRSEVNPPVARNKAPTPRYPYQCHLDGYITFDENGYCVPHGVTLVDPAVCLAILHNYDSLVSAPQDTDMWYLIQEFQDTMDRALAHEPLYKAIVEDKLNALQNSEIQQDLLDRFGTTHSLEYISSLWCKKIPNLIASQAEDDYLDWYYTNVEKGKWKRCSRCGKIKLAHNKYFSRNTTSKDKFYSICKECRNKGKEDS